MKIINKEPDLLLTYLKQNKIATITEIQIVLKTQSRMTVLRKLTRLDYISSFSHSGKYYSLKRTARFNKYGIWSFKSILFSKYETLKKTMKFLIGESSKGLTAFELNSILKVKVEDALLELVRDKSVIRKKMSGIYVYYSATSESRRKQELIRTKRIINPENGKTITTVLMSEIKAALIIFLSTLNEKQRRLYAGLESLKIGYGGDKQIAELFGLDKKTIAKGRQELLSGEVENDTIRKSGAGRKNIKKKF